jgi:heme oxygenase
MGNILGPYGSPTAMRGFVTFDSTLVIPADEGLAHSTLRAATRSVHLATHGLPVMRLLLSDELDRPTYLRVLCRLWGFVRAVEETASLADEIVPPRLPDLQADLEWLGMDASAIFRLPTCPLPASIRTSATGRLGAAYVLQGSRYGGLAIALHVNVILGLGPETGAAFFSSRGLDLIVLRTALWEFIEAGLDDEDSRASAVAAAIDTFNAFFAWFEAWEGGASGSRHSFDTVTRPARSI